MEYYISQGNAIFALGAAPAGHTDQTRQLAIGLPRGRQRDQTNTFLQPEFAANKQLKPYLLCRYMGLYYPGQRAFIGNSQRAIAQLCGLLHQLVRV